MLAGQGAIPKSTRRAHPESQRTQEGHHGGAEPPMLGQAAVQAVLLGRRGRSWGSWLQAAQPRDAAGDLRGQGNKSGVQSAQTQLRAGVRAWPWHDLTARLPAGHGPQPTLEQPTAAAVKMQLGFCRASPHWLSRGPCPATHSGHVPSPSHVPSCSSAPAF